MAFCERCGKEVSEGAQFCRSCGAALNTTPPSPVAVPTQETKLPESIEETGFDESSDEMLDIPSPVAAPLVSPLTRHRRLLNRVLAIILVAAAIAGLVGMLYKVPFVSVYRVTDGSTVRVISESLLSTYNLPATLWSPERKHGVTSMALSPDGELLATGITGYSSPSVTITLWRVSDGSKVRTLAGDASHSLTFSPDGRLLLSGGEGSINLWRVEDGNLLHTFDYSQRADVAFSPDGKLLAIETTRKEQTRLGYNVELWHHNVVDLWRIEDNIEKIRSVSGSKKTDEVVARPPSAGEDAPSGGPAGYSSGPPRGYHTGSSVAFSPDGQFIAAGVGEGSITLWRVEDGAELNTYSYTGSTSDDSSDTFERYVKNLCFSPDGNMVAIEYDDGEGIKFWKAESGKPIFILKWIITPSEGGNSPFQFSTDGKLLISTGSGGIYFWEVDHEAVVRSFPIHNFNDGAAISPDGKLLAVRGWYW